MGEIKVSQIRVNRRIPLFTLTKDYRSKGELRIFFWWYTDPYFDAKFSCFSASPTSRHKTKPKPLTRFSFLKQLTLFLNLYHSRSFYCFRDLYQLLLFNSESLSCDCTIWYIIASLPYCITFVLK